MIFTNWGSVLTSGFRRGIFSRGGEFLRQSLNIAQEGLLVLMFELALVGDPTQGLPHRQGDVWPSGVWIVISCLAGSMLDLSIQVVSGLFAQELADGINFAYAFDLGLRLDKIAVVFANHFAE